MNIHEIIHAWERNVLPEDLEQIKVVSETVENHKAEMGKWLKEAVSVPVQSYYQFDLGLCDHMMTYLEKIKTALAGQSESAPATDLIVIEDATEIMDVEKMMAPKTKRKKGGEPT